MKSFIKYIFIYLLVSIIAPSSAHAKRQTFYNTDQLDTLTRSVPHDFLLNRTILLDPGHGGYHQPGAVGKYRLKETDLNLTVSLYLWGLLKSAGADVYITRTVDRAVLTDSPPLLRQELKSRVGFSGLVNPDLYLSIHHNSRTRQPRHDAFEIYYKSNSPMSKDISEAVLKIFEKYSNQKIKRMLPGNYYVLRHNHLPALLGEAAYITNRGAAANLKRFKTLETEAKLYFLSLIDFFSKGFVELKVNGSSDTVFRDNPPAIHLAYHSDRNTFVLPGSLKCYLNDKPFSFSVDNVNDSELLINIDTPLPNGSYLFKGIVENNAGNHSPYARYRFEIDRPADNLGMYVSVSELPQNFKQVIIPVLVSASDRYGFSLKDGTPLEYDIVNGSLVSDTPVLDGGKALIMIKPETDPVTFNVSAGSHTRTYTWAVKDAPYVYLSVKSMKDSHPLSGVNAVIGKERYESDTIGIIRLDAGRRTGVTTIILSRVGFYPYIFPYPFTGKESTIFMSVKLVPLAGGGLLDKKILLDPALLSTKNDKEEEVLNELCRKISYYLGYMGAQPILISGESARLPDFNKVELSSELKVDRYIRITFNKLERKRGGVEIGHYFNSRNGTDLCNKIINYISGVRKFRYSGEVEYNQTITIQTSMPAIVISLPGYMRNPERYGGISSGRIEALAYMISLGIAEHFSDKKSVSIMRQKDVFQKEYLFKRKPRPRRSRFF